MYHSSQEVFEIDIKMQTFKQQGHHSHIENLQAVKVELQKKLIGAQINLKLENAKSKIHWVVIGKGVESSQVFVLGKPFNKPLNLTI